MNLLIIFSAKYLYILAIIIPLVFAAKQTRKVQKEMGLFILISFPLAYISAKTFGKFFYNARPFVVENIQPLIAHAANNGFPSDHTLLTCTIGAVCYFFNKKLGLVIVLLSLLVGYARVVAGIHHQLDIWGAIVIAVFSVFLTNLFIRKILKFKP